MAYAYNIFHWDEGMDTDAITAILDSIYLKLDQTTPQIIANGLPLFEDGIKIGNSSTKFILNGNTLELWVNGTKVQDWTITPVAGTSGSPIGLLLSLTYA